MNRSVWSSIAPATVAAVVARPAASGSREAVAGPEVVARPARVPGGQMAGHGADHEHVGSGQVVVHNGLATVDRMDAALGEDLRPDALARP